jgi:hypothetical protein
LTASRGRALDRRRAIFQQPDRTARCVDVRHAVPTVYQFREFAASGGLASYGTGAESSRLAGVYTGVSSRARSPPTCRFSRTRRSIWSSMSGPRRRSASPPRSHFSQAPTR